MNSLNPIYTENKKCQDCYKCIRECPVKAIKVEGGCASVVSSLCILCGHCVEVCPNGAKRVRNDLNYAKQLLQAKPRVLVSLAPSFVSEFSHSRPGQLVAAIRRLGFYGVSETALGAEQVSAHAAELLQMKEPRLHLSTACPSIVEYLRKYQTRYAPYFTDLLSPLLAHCKMLRREFGHDIGVVFIGPCISKKREAELHPLLLDVVLTFEDLKAWLAEVHIDPGRMEEGPYDVFVPHPAQRGVLYPIEGGMIAGIKSNCTIEDSRFMSFSGVRNIDKALAGLDELPLREPLFVELLACEGGCINGPRTSDRSATACKRYKIIDYSQPEAPEAAADKSLQIVECYPAQPAPESEYSEARIREILSRVGKYTEEDELNCGGCGYDSCREFARAFIDGKAEHTMCVAYMRALAQKKANALIQKMPSAVVIVDAQLKILECNPHFVRIFARDKEAAQAPPAALEGVDLESVMPFSSYFTSVLESGKDILDRDIRHRGRVLHASIFSIEKHAIAGALFEDITAPAMQKEQIIKRSRQVIQQNLQTVQKIAYLIGENAAESEIILNSIVESFSPSELANENE